MASFFQTQKPQPDDARSSLAARAELSRHAFGYTPTGRMASGALSELRTPREGSLAKVLISLKRFLAERDEASTWSPTLGARQGGYSLQGADGGKESDGAIQAPWETMPLRGDHARKSVWGSWQ